MCKLAGRILAAVAVSVSLSSTPSRPTSTLLFGTSVGGGQVTSTSQCPGSNCPGVTLQAIDGESMTGNAMSHTYFSRHGWTIAHSQGWDSQTFFALGPWEGYLGSGCTNTCISTPATDVGTFNDVGFTILPNVAVIDPATANSSGISVIDFNISGSSPTDAAALGGLIASDDSATSYSQCCSTPIGSMSSSTQVSRFWWVNLGWTQIGQGSLSGSPAGTTGLGCLQAVSAPSSCGLLLSPITVPGGGTRHLDMYSIDIYWFTGANDATTGIFTEGQDIYNLGSAMTSAQAKCGCRYGDVVTYLRANPQSGASKDGGTNNIIYMNGIENGWPYSQTATGSEYIKPTEMNWAAWSSIIHGARGIYWFNNSFSGPGASNNDIETSYFQSVQSGNSVSVYSQTKTTDALIASLAQQISSPVGLDYVTVSPAGYHWTASGSIIGEVIDNNFSGIEVRPVWDGTNWYIFSDTRSPESSTNISATFTLADATRTSVTVVGEGRNISVSSGVFTDTFANAWTVHIYKVFFIKSHKFP